MYFSDVKAALDFIASQLGKKVKVLLADHFPIIFPKLVTQVSSTSEYQKCTKYVEEITRVPTKELVKGNRKRVITELLLHYHSNPKRVKTGFSFIAKHDDDFKCNKGEKLTDLELAEYIKPRFLGVLNFFDQKLKDESCVNLGTIHNLRGH